MYNYFLIEVSNNYFKKNFEFIIFTNIFIYSI